MNKVFVVSIDLENIGVAESMQLAEEIISEHLKTCGVEESEEDYEDSFNEYAIEKFILRG